jgi:hypothetical protein
VASLLKSTGVWGGMAHLSQPCRDFAQMIFWVYDFLV